MSSHKFWTSATVQKVWKVTEVEDDCGEANTLMLVYNVHLKVKLPEEVFIHKNKHLGALVNVK